MQEPPLVFSANFDIFFGDMRTKRWPTVQYIPSPRHHHPPPPRPGDSVLAILRRKWEGCGVGMVSGSWRLGVGTGEWGVQSWERGLESGWWVSVLLWGVCVCALSVWWVFVVSEWWGIGREWKGMVRDEWVVSEWWVSGEWVKGDWVVSEWMVSEWRMSGEWMANEWWVSVLCGECVVWWVFSVVSVVWWLWWACFVVSVLCCECV